MVMRERTPFVQEGPRQRARLYHRSAPTQLFCDYPHPLAGTEYGKPRLSAIVNQPVKPLRRMAGVRTSRTDI